MFKSVNSLITKKYSKLLKIKNKSFDIEKSFKRFLNDQFGQIARKISYSLVYNDKNGSLIIKTESKIFANELSLRMNELVKTIKTADIKLRRIVIQ